MAGKGDHRRPSQVSQKQVDANWDRIFKNGDTYRREVGDLTSEEAEALVQKAKSRVSKNLNSQH